MHSSHLDEPLVLALIVPLKDRVGLIELTSAYKFELHVLSELRSRDEIVKIKITRLPEVVIDEALSAASLTVLYGENGWGKTHLMLAACTSLSNKKGERGVAVVWEQHGALFCDIGTRLENQIQFSTESLAEAPRLLPMKRALPAIFYTTSPFEAAKRRSLVVPSILDVTPSFSPDNPFNGADLLRAYEKLPRAFSFIEKADARLRLKIPSLESVVQRVLNALSPNYGTPETAAYAPRPDQRRALLRLGAYLYPGLSEALSIELLMALRTSKYDARDMIGALSERIDLYDVNGSALTDEDLGKQFNTAILDLLATIPYSRADVPNALEIRNFLNNELSEKIRRMKKRVGLAEWISALDNFREKEWDLLRRLESLGIAKWSFRALSSGQVALLLLFSSLASALNKIEAQNVGPVFVFIDEGEMFMHPSWQRRYITDMLDFIGHYPRIAKRVHIVISTHSMIVAADAPPNRLFDVRAGEMTNGFGYGPKDLLGHIYQVDEFQGENAARIMQQLVDYLLRGQNSVVTAETAAAIADQIADDRLRAYLSNEVRRRMERHDA